MGNGKQENKKREIYAKKNLYKKKKESKKIPILCLLFLSFLNKKKNKECLLSFLVLMSCIVSAFFCFYSFFLFKTKERKSAFFKQIVFCFKNRKKGVKKHKRDTKTLFLNLHLFYYIPFLTMICLIVFTRNC